MLKYILSRAIVLAVAVGVICVVMLHVSYRPVRDGKLYLERANSTSTFIREGSTGIHHIRADNLEMAVYTQGFAHA